MNPRFARRFGSPDAPQFGPGDHPGEHPGPGEVQQHPRLVERAARELLLPGAPARR